LRSRRPDRSSAASPMSPAAASGPTCRGARRPRGATRPGRWPLPGVMRLVATLGRSRARAPGHVQRRPGWSWSCRPPARGRDRELGVAASRPGRSARPRRGAR
jgi:hypothetical protein